MTDFKLFTLTVEGTVWIKVSDVVIWLIKSGQHDAADNFRKLEFPEEPEKKT